MPDQPRDYDVRETPSDTRHRARHHRVIAPAVTWCALAIAACGTSSNSTTSGGSSPLAVPVEFAACMRAHGVPSFTDPAAGGQAPTVGPVDKGSPAFHTAEQALQEPAGEAGERQTPYHPGAATQAGRVHARARRAELPRPTPRRRVQHPADGQPTVAGVHRRGERMREALR